MNASKEECDKAIEEFEKIRAHLDGDRAEVIDPSFVQEFLRKCRGRLPTEAAIARDKAKGKGGKGER